MNENTNMELVEDVAENLEEVTDVATDSNLKKIAIGAGITGIIIGAAYFGAKLVKKGISTLKSKKLQKEAEADTFEDDFEDFEDASYEEQVRPAHENN